MLSLQLIARAVVSTNGRTLLVKKKRADFWHYPGGKWEFEKESLKDCVVREIKEETGLNIEVGELLWCQEIRKPEKVYMELFWKAKLNPQQQINDDDNISLDEDIEEIAWLGKDDLKNSKVLPKLF